MKQRNLSKPSNVDLMLNLVSKYIQLDDNAIEDKGFVGKSSNYYEVIDIEYIEAIKGQGLEDLTTKLIKKVELTLDETSEDSFNILLKGLIFKNFPDNSKLRRKIKDQSSWKNIIMAVFYEKALKRAKSAADHCIELFSYARGKYLNKNMASNDESWTLINKMNGNHLKHIEDVMMLGDKYCELKQNMLKVMGRGLDFPVNTLKSRERLLGEFKAVLQR